MIFAAPAQAAVRGKRERKHPAGRPSKYAPAVVARIRRAVRNGCSREAAAGLAGISATTLYEWQREFPQFSQGLQKADSEFEAVCVASIRKAGQNPRNWTANSWLLERKFPQRYGKVDRHVIRAQHEVAELPPDYVQAVCRAIGVSGEFKPLIGATENDVIDLPTLP